MTSWTPCAGCEGEVINEYPISHPGRIFGFAHLKRHEPAIITHNGIGSLIALKIAEVGQALQGTAPIQPELPKIDVAGALPVLA